jgi:hypothetical protein
LFGFVSSKSDFPLSIIKPYMCVLELTNPIVLPDAVLDAGAVQIAAGRFFFVARAVQIWLLSVQIVACLFFARWELFHRGNFVI